MSSLAIKPIEKSDYDWVTTLLVQNWNGPEIVTRGVVHEANRLPGFKAVLGGKSIGLLTYRLAAFECEIVTLDSLQEGIGVGTKLMTAVRELAGGHNCRRLWLITTNDNARAVKFYEKMGYRIAAVHAGAIAESRQLKPSIPIIGFNGVEIRDEIEMELILC